MTDQQQNGLRSRRHERFSHVYIPLWVQISGAWKSIKASDWNEYGFNFYFPELFSTRSIELRCDMRQFPGAVVWTLRNESEHAAVEIVLNDLLFKQLQRMHKMPDTVSRVFKLIRTSGLVQEKKDMLLHLGGTLDPDKLRTLTGQRNKGYRYGVQVSHDIWRSVVRKTLEQTASLLRMGRQHSAGEQ